MSNDSPRLGLWDRLTQLGSHRSSLHCWAGGHYDTAPWVQVVRDSERATAGLRRLGVRPGARVAAVLTNGPVVVRGLLAVWLAGGAMASLPALARGMDAAEYFEQLATICDQLDPVVVLVDEPTLAGIPDTLKSRLRIRSWESVMGSGRIAPEPPADDELAFIQYSSGSTSSPKGCMLTPRAIAAQIDIITAMIDARPGRDVGVSWMPLSHDMGLFGTLLTTWCNDIEYFMSTPQRFVTTPAGWFSELAQFGGTLTAGTNTSLYLAARSAARSTTIARDGLSRIRNCIIGAERVDWETLTYAMNSLGRFGLRPQAFMPAYGLAEATLAVTALPSDQRPRRVTVDANSLAAGQLSEAAAEDPLAASIVSAGPPCDGVSVPGMRAEAVTEIVVRSPSLATGYWANTSATERKFRHGAVRSGDLGFLRGGELYVTGRADDVVSIAGRKVHAQEVEHAVERVEGLRPGCSTLITGTDGAAQRISLFLEPRATASDYQRIAEAAASAAMAKAAIAVDECVILDRGSLPKTPSGKIQRHRCRSLYETGQLEPLATVRFT
jgi:fatty-acyl-CoA synthase